MSIYPTILFIHLLFRIIRFQMLMAQFPLINQDFLGNHILTLHNPVYIQNLLAYIRQKGLLMDRFS